MSGSQDNPADGQASTRINLFIDAKDLLVPALKRALSVKDTTKDSVVLDFIDAPDGADIIIRQVRLEHWPKPGVPWAQAEAPFQQQLEIVRKNRPTSVVSSDHPVYPAVLFFDWEELPNEGPALFLDSSIWHRYVPLKDADVGLRVLRDLLVKMTGWRRQGRHSLHVAVESLDYAVRSLEMNRLRSISSHHHGEFVSLHGFASETRCAEGALSPNLESVNVIDHRFLLVDDYAGEVLDGIGGVKSATRAQCAMQGGPPSKGGIVRHELAQIRLPKDKTATMQGCSKDKPDAVTGKPRYPCTATGSTDVCVESLATARMVLAEPGGMFDVILLDYLLGKRTDGGPGRESGTELVEWLNACAEKGTSKVAEANQGPAGRYWIFPISAFPAAFAAELMRGGIETFGENCIVAAGADPVCTPELFKWQLLRFLKRQRAYVTEAVRSRLEEFCLGELDSLPEKAESGLAQRAHRHFTRRQERIARWLDDCARGSLVSERVIPAGLADKATEAATSAPHCLKGLSGEQFRRLFPYLENYLRLLAYHRQHSRNAMLLDLETMKRMVERDPRSSLFGEWLSKQRGGL